MKSGEWDRIKRVFALVTLALFFISYDAFPAELRIQGNLDRSLTGVSIRPVITNESGARAWRVQSAFNYQPISLICDNSDSPLSVGPEKSNPKDTVETYDVVIEEEKEHNIYKEIAAFVIASAVVGYIIYLLINPGEEEQTQQPSNGKDIHFQRALIRLPLH